MTGYMDERMKWRKMNELSDGCAYAGVCGGGRACVRGTDRLIDGIDGQQIWSQTNLTGSRNSAR
eukprot:scaffold621328_cov18-Prasinocladus_malaysianus.AAC.2